MAIGMIMKDCPNSGNESYAESKHDFDLKPYHGERTTTMGRLEIFQCLYPNEYHKACMAPSSGTATNRSQKPVICSKSHKKELKMVSSSGFHLRERYH
jgi:hypothetical protein